MSSQPLDLWGLRPIFWVYYLPSHRMLWGTFPLGFQHFSILRIQHGGQVSLRLFPSRNNLKRSGRELYFVCLKLREQAKYLNWTLCSDRLPQRARGRCLARSGLLVEHVPSAKSDSIYDNKSLIDQACSVKMTEYWPRSSYFDSVLVRKHATKNLANIQTSWLHTWSKTHISSTHRHQNRCSKITAICCLWHTFS